MAKPAQLSEQEISQIMDDIEAVRARNNKFFMKMWRLVFRLAPQEAAEIQKEIRRGDMLISELNARLAGE